MGAILEVETYLVRPLSIWDVNWYRFFFYRFQIPITRSIYLNDDDFYLFNFIQVRRKIDLVYGGGSVGLMGLISQAVHDGGCHVLG